MINFKDKVDFKDTTSMETQGDHRVGEGNQWVGGKFRGSSNRDDVDYHSLNIDRFLVAKEHVEEDSNMNIKIRCEWYGVYSKNENSSCLNSSSIFFS